VPRGVPQVASLPGVPCAAPHSREPSLFAPQEGVEIAEPRLIAKKYLTGQRSSPFSMPNPLLHCPIAGMFLVDAVSSIPFSWFYSTAGQLARPPASSPPALPHIPVHREQVAGSTQDGQAAAHRQVFPHLGHEAQHQGEPSQGRAANISDTGPAPQALRAVLMEREMKNSNIAMVRLVFIVFITAVSHALLAWPAPCADWPALPCPARSTGWPASSS